MKIFDKQSFKIDLPEDEQIALRKFISCLEELYNQLKLWNTTLKPYMALTELENIIFQTEFSSSHGVLGVEVLSISDSIYPDRKFIFALGMTQQGFPVRQAANPFISGVEDEHYNANNKIFITWNNSADKVILTYPEIDSKGKPILPSDCMENLSIETIMHPVDFESTKQLKTTIGNWIQTEVHDPLLIRQIDRHNAFVENPVPLEYFGSLSDSCHNLKDKITSATALDELHFKPLYFLLNRGWGIKELDRKTSDLKDKGTFIHEVFEQFGNAGGWDINRQNKFNGELLLLKTVETVLNKWMKSSPITTQALSELNLSEPTLWQHILEEDREFYPEFTHVKSEQGFGQDEDDSLPYLIFSHPELGDIKLKGSIDRFDRSKDGRVIIAQDYKSGRIPWDMDAVDMPRQLFIYALILNQEFSQSKLAIGYRKVKSIKQREWGFHPSFILEGDVETFAGIQIKNSKSHIHLNHIDEIKTLLEKSFIPILSGEFEPVSMSSKTTIDYYHLKATSRIETIRYFLKG